MLAVSTLLLIMVACMLGLLALAATPLIIIAVVFGGWYGS